MFAKLSFHFQQARHGVLSSTFDHDKFYHYLLYDMHVDLTRSCKLLIFFLYFIIKVIPEQMLGLMHKSQFYSVINTRWLHE